MTSPLQQYQELATLVGMARQTLDADSSVAQCVQSCNASGLTAFLRSRITEITGINDFVLSISNTSAPGAFTYLWFNSTGLDKKLKDAGKGILRNYHTVNKTVFKTPLVRDFLRQARDSTAQSIHPMPNKDRFAVSIKLTKGLFIAQTQGRFTYTDQEIAGILCHELGHSLWNLASSEQILAVDGWYREAIGDASSYPPVKELKTLLQLVKDGSRLSPPLLKVIDALLSASVKDGDTSYRNYADLAVWAIMAASGQVKKNALDTFYPKTSDRGDVRDADTAKERFCDTFAGACGYGPGLASALVKMSQDHFSPESFARRYGLNDMDALLSAIMYPGVDTAMGGYDPLYDRFKDSITATKQVLQDPSLTPEMKQTILASITEGERKYAEYMSQPYVQMRRRTAKLYQALQSVTHLSLSGLIDVVSATMRDFNQALQVYGSGELDYLAAMLENAT